MATTKSRTTTKKTTTAPKTEIVKEEIAAEEVAQPAEEAIVEEAPQVKEKVIQKKEAKKEINYADVDPNQTVMVINGFNGRLVYKSKRTGERFIWNEMGDEQEMDIRELRNAKNSAKGFFIKNWFMFGEDDQWVIDYLAMGQYYKNSIPIDGYDQILMSNAKIIESKLANIPDGQKASLAGRAAALIKSGDIDSNKAIAALENIFGVELVER